MKIAALLLLLAAPVFACEKDCPPFPITSNQIVCACDAKTDIGEPVKPSDEKPRMSGQPVEQSMVIDKAKPAEATDEGTSVRIRPPTFVIEATDEALDALAAKTARQTDREMMPVVK